MSTPPIETPKKKSGKGFGVNISSMAPPIVTRTPFSDTRKRKKRSQWHQYFISRDDEPDFVTCKSCGQEVKCRNGTGSMRWHVLNQCGPSKERQVNDPTVEVEADKPQEGGINKIRFRVEAGRMRDQLVSLRDNKAIITLNLPLTVHLSLN
eukprot:snap_masked-scaffold_93-processed-gene-0.20-mRNA-1 protein AED:1.00 eAED:1.00 QI:0/-1/0/0/-1/1/1/0/150